MILTDTFFVRLKITVKQEINGRKCETAEGLLVTDISH